MKFFPDIYARSPSEIARIQDGLLREAISRAARTSPFYRERFSSGRLDAAGVRTLADLPRLPLTSKEDIQGRNQDFWAAPRDRLVEVVATTGTTGEAVYVAMTEQDLERLGENERRGFSWLGAKPGDRFHIAITLDNLFIAGLAYHLGLHALGAAAIRVGAQPARRHLDLMQRLRPEGVVAVPSLLLALARQAEKDGDDLRSFAPRRAMLIGDAIRGQSLASNTLGSLLEEAWRGELFSTYGLTEAGLAYHECPMHLGLHSHPDLVVTEVVDDAGRPVPDGEVGELVITTLQVEGTPLIRYRSGDVSFIVPGACPCGRGGPRIGPILGRKQHRLKVKGTTLYPKTIEDALLSLEGVENFVIEAHRGDDETDRLVVRIGTLRDDPGFGKLVGDTLYAKARVTPEIHLAAPAEVEGLLFEGGRRKPRVFVDLRKRAGKAP
ncbi:MAG TPA: AMP-binding protein [Candidatus Methylomirabilis sp.]|nr:AMP-binding protein [Candidatus Methylomirabilis sp.]